MKLKIFVVSILLVLGFAFAFAEDVLTEEVALEQIEMEQARLDAAEAKLAECQGVLADLEEQYDALVAERDELAAELEDLQASRGFYTVKSGDWLSKLAEYPEVYGKGNWRRWPDIYKANKKLIKDPDLIYPNWKLIIPRP